MALVSERDLIGDSVVEVALALVVEISRGNVLVLSRRGVTGGLGERKKRDRWIR